jgi:hypothetical protein
MKLSLQWQWRLATSVNYSNKGDLVGFIEVEDTYIRKRTFIY